ncbi:MAG: DEAD/DEAH box helicase, partial [Thermomicrobiales bacterium]
MTTVAPPPPDLAATQPLPVLDEADLGQLAPPLLLRYLAWLRLSGQFTAAADALQFALATRGASAQLLDEQSALALAEGDAAKVRAAWEDRLARNPAPSARASFGRALLELGELEEASQLAEELLAGHSELATVHALYAEVALQQGDVATAHSFWSGQLAQDATRITPQLAMARLALLGGDSEEARATLQHVLTSGADLTAAQLGTAATLAEMLGQAQRGQMLRYRVAQMEAQRTAALVAGIAEALGWEAPPAASASYGEVPARPVTAGPTVDRANGAAPPATTERAAPNREPSETAPETAAHVAPEATLLSVPIDQELSDPRVLETLQQVFGFAGLRPGQAAVVNQVLAGRDTLAILPTGAGKSLTFQLPSLLLPHMTLVLSPLIALMKDQVEGLPPALRERTVLLNSTISPEEQRAGLADIASGAPALVYA